MMVLLRLESLILVSIWSVVLDLEHCGLGLEVMVLFTSLPVAHLCHLPVPVIGAQLLMLLF